jgi:hypothetical protein
MDVLQAGRFVGEDVLEAGRSVAGRFVAGVPIRHRLGQN